MPQVIRGPVTHQVTGPLASEQLLCATRRCAAGGVQTIPPAATVKVATTMFQAPAGPRAVPRVTWTSLESGWNS